MNKNSIETSTFDQKNMTSEQIMREAWTAAEGAIFDSYRQSLPIPLKKNNDLFLKFFYLNSRNRPRLPSILFHPSWTQIVEYPSGKMTELKIPLPSEFGLLKWEASMGELSLPPNITLEEFYSKTQILLKTLDELLPFFVNVKDVVPSSIKRLKNDFKTIFSEISEPPLRAFYSYLGRDFFAWLDI